MRRKLTRDLSDQINISVMRGLHAAGWGYSFPKFKLHRDQGGDRHACFQWTDTIPGTALPFLAGFRISTFTEYEFAISFDSAATADHKCARFFPGNALTWLGGGILRVACDQIGDLSLYEQLGERIGRLLASIKTTKADWPLGNSSSSYVRVRAIAEFLSADETEGGADDSL